MATIGRPLKAYTFVVQGLTPGAGSPEHQGTIQQRKLLGTTKELKVLLAITGFREFLDGLKEFNNSHLKFYKT